MEKMMMEMVMARLEALEKENRELKERIARLEEESNEIWMRVEELEE